MEMVQSMPHMDLPRLRGNSGRACRLDALPWRAGIAFSSYGVPLGIRSDDPELLLRAVGMLPAGWQQLDSSRADRLYSLLSPSAAHGCGEPGRYGLYRGARRLPAAACRDEVLRALEQDVHLHVAEYAPAHVFVHAGVVGWHGRALLFPGRSFAGKSTLVARLLAAGASYYSDEYAVLDERGRVHPFPRPLSLRIGEGTRRLPHTAYGAALGTGPLPVGAVLVTRYRSGARWPARPLSPGEAVLALFRHTICGCRRPVQALQVLREAMLRARAFAGPRGEADQLLPTLARLAGEWQAQGTAIAEEGTR